MTREDAMSYIIPAIARTWNDKICKQIKEVLNEQPCEDAISRQAAIDCLTATGLKKFDFILQAREKIKKLPSVSTEKTWWWIPVSERLPEKSTWVLVTCKNSDGYIFLDIKLINQYTGLWEDEDFSGTVLAWMPLPQPYKGESEDKE